ncbi:MAG: hypothetical protein ACI9U2_001941 [Bradymonadia bacterium]|jgi:hypothetical protein
MICGYCSETIEGTPEACPACAETPLLDARYRLDSIVGRGAMGVTYRAERLADGHIVAIKELPFRRIDAVKTKAMFAREARVLEQLDHPGIPAYLDDFLGGVGKNLSLYLVQTFVEGQTLKAEMAARRWREDEVLALIADVADILVYLHELSPPVIHRDIKPGNIMRQADGSLALIDFGAVRDALDDEHTGGSTVVGTYGFMAPEQFRGDASRASDLYALGATAVALLSRKTPDTMVNVAGHLDWAPHVDVHAQTRALLDDLLQIDPTRRSQKARTVAHRCRAAITAIQAARAAKPATPSQRAPTPALPGLIHPALGPNVVAPNERFVEVESTDFGPTPQRAGRGALFATGGLALMILIIGVMAAVSNAPKNSASTFVDPARRCGDTPCPPVARGLKGLEFGMTRIQAIEALPELANATSKSKHLPIDIMNLGAIGQLKQLGDVAVVSTTLGGLPTTCEVEFLDAGTLTGMTCTLDPPTSKASHVAAQDALSAALIKRYGPPSEQWSGSQNAYMDEINRTWSWTDDKATLKLKSNFSDFAGMTAVTSSLVLVNEGPEHRRILDAAEAEREAGQRAQRAQTKREGEEAARKAREALESGNLADDL